VADDGSSIVLQEFGRDRPSQGVHERRRGRGRREATDVHAPAAEGPVGGVREESASSAAARSA